MEFLNEAKKRGYNFATSYVHRNVIVRRIDAGERLVLVQKYDPDKLDYYRTDLDGGSFLIGTADRTLANIEALGLEGKISALE